MAKQLRKAIGATAAGAVCCILQADTQEIRIGDLLAQVDAAIVAETATPVEEVASEPSTQPKPEEMEPESYALEEEEVLSAVKAHLLELYPLDGDLIVRFYRRWYPVEVPDGSWELTLGSIPGDSLAALTTARVRIQSGDTIIEERRVTLVCELWQDVLVPKKPLTRADLLEPGLFDIQRIDALKARSPLVLAGTAVENYELKQSASVGEPLVWRNLEARPLIRKGQVVEVRASEGLFEITMRGYALEDGADGEFISIRNLSSRRDFQAQVIDENTVKVYF